MNGHEFLIAGARLVALPTGALWWAERGLLIVSDLHLGKSERFARRGGSLLPPYETQDTLSRLEREITATGAQTVLCLGDSFDDRAAADALAEEDQLWIRRLQAGRRWVWIEGNHDPGETDFGGTYLGELLQPPLTFRHIAIPGASGEVSGHYHPKAQINVRGRVLSRACFLYDGDRVILPAFGTYTGGLRATDPALSALLREDAWVVLTGRKAQALPLARLM